MKKAFNLVACISAIVLMSIMLIGCFALMGYGLTGILLGITVGIIIFCIGTIIVAALAIAKEKQKCGFGLKITVIVLIGIIMILEFVGNGIVYGVLCLIPIGFEIASLCVKSTTKVETQTYDSKIEELKHLKELGAISEEQYNEALKTLFEQAK